MVINLDFKDPKTRKIAIAAAIGIIALVLVLILAGGHRCSFDQEVVDNITKVSDATCNSRATYYYSCECGKMGSQTFSFGEVESHNLVYHPETLATVSAAGNVEYWECLLCGGCFYDSYAYSIVWNKSDLEVPMVDHTCYFDGEAIVSEANCKSAAVYCGVCTVCGAYSENTYEYGGVGDHFYKEIASYTAPTCTSAGYCYKLCAYCGKRSEETFVQGEPLDHIYVENAAPDYLAASSGCESAPVYYKSCYACGASGTETFSSGAPLGHDYSAKTTDYPANIAQSCKEIATYYMSCIRCGKKGTSTYQGGYGPHSYVNEKIAPETLKSAANCMSAAVYYKTCSCGAISTYDADTFVDKNGEKGNHVLNGVSIDLDKPLHVNTRGVLLLPNMPATCTENGMGYFTCECCKGVFSVNTYVDHKPSGNVETFSKIVNGTEELYKKYHCSTCDKVVEEKADD